MRLVVVVGMVLGCGRRESGSHGGGGGRGSEASSVFVAHPSRHINTRHLLPRRQMKLLLLFFFFALFRCTDSGRFDTSDTYLWISYVRELY